VCPLDLFITLAIVLTGLAIVCIYSAVQARKASWQCATCKKISNPPIIPLLLAPHSKGHKYMRCPACKQKAFLKPVAKQK